MHHCTLQRVFCTCALWLAVSWPGMAWAAKPPTVPLSRSDTVGRVAVNRFVTPTGQLLTPAGQQIELPGQRPQALALSPDGAILVASGRSNALFVIEAGTGNILQTVSLATNRAEAKVEGKAAAFEDPLASSEIPPAPGAKTNAPFTGARLSLTGLVFSPDGSRIYLSTAGHGLRVFPVSKKHVVRYPFQLPVPDAKAPKRREEIPAGLAVSADGLRLYVVGNLGNKLYELEAQTGRLLHSWNTGVAPYDVVLVGHKAYVSNLGGRRPGTNDLTAPAGKGTTVRVDPVRHIPNEGSVTVIDLQAGGVSQEILVELHPSGLAVSPDQKYVVVANTGSDTLSVIDTATDQVVEKIWVRQTAADLFGAQPNALAFDRSGKRIFVCNGTQNAVAVVEFEPEDRLSQVVGLIPVGWFPGAIVYDRRHGNLCVANIKGEGALNAFKPGEKIRLFTKNFYGTVSLVPLPSKKTLATQTELALENMRYPKLWEAKLPPRPNQPARPVPERVGEPSLFKHVIYVIKENRSYDQVLGDVKEGNGNYELCTFGERYTPNQHKIVREFVLLDNTFCAGVQSAEGHQWTDSGIANEYVERQLSSEFPRSYTGGKEEDAVDALAWSSSGFIWDNAMAHGKTFRNYGEWMISKADWIDKKEKGHREKPTFQDFMKDYSAKTNLTRLRSQPGIETLRKCSPTNTVGWDLNVPDVMRAAFFIKELRQFETNGGFPDWVYLFLPNDHTGGTRGKSPKPGAQVADNDLAFGQIVEALTHSKFWPETCLIAIEDDPQAGWDHVSGYRTTCYVISPYTKRGQTISTQYNHLSVLRTLELILGLPPMNHMDATATPMHDCFMDTADLTPFVSVPNQVPLDQQNPEPKKIADPLLRRDAVVSARLRLDEADRCPEDVLNRILWRAMKGSEVPYPEWAVKLADKD